MSFVLHVDGERWRASHDRFVADHPGVVPVIKGNGYGFGRDLLCAEASRLGVPMIAVGTYAELPTALGAFGRDVLVMEPFRAAVHAGLPDLASRQGRPHRHDPPGPRGAARRGSPLPASSSRGSRR